MDGRHTKETEERRASTFRAWGVSIALHAVLFLLLAATGFFLLVREQPTETPDDVVDITMLESGGGGGGGAPQPAPAPAPASAPAVTMPSATTLPEITETYTKEPEKQQEYRQEHHAEPPVAAGATSASSEGTGTSGAGEGVGTGTGAGSGSGSGTGSSTGAGTGTGSGAGAGGGTDSSTEPPAPVDAGAYCTYRAVPSYPQSMVQSGAEGSVTVLIIVSPDSVVTSVDVVSSSGYPALDQAAVAAGWVCRFSMNGHPGRYRTTYRFELQDGDDW